VDGFFYTAKTIDKSFTTLHTSVTAFHIFMLLCRLFTNLSLCYTETVKRINMKKGILLIVVLAAWMMVKDRQPLQLIAADDISVQQQATLIAKHVQQQILSFTTVHLYKIKIKTNNCKQTVNTRSLQACRKAQRINHETLLTINSL
jgi:hypothetical protein